MIEGTQGKEQEGKKRGWESVENSVKERKKEKEWEK